MSAFQWEFQAGGGASADKLTAALKTLAIAITRLTATQQHQKTTTQNVNTQIINSTTIINDYKRAAGDAGDKSKSWFDRLKDGIHTIASFTGTIAGITQAIYGSGKAFMSWVVGSTTGADSMELSLRAVAESAGATKEQIQGLIDQSRQLARTSRFNPEQTLNAATQALKAGVDVTTVKRDQEAYLKGGLAAGLTPDKAAMAATHALGFFGKEIGTADKALAGLSASANASQVDVHQLDAALGRGGTTAQRVGMSYMRFLAVMGLFHDSQIRAGRAGNDFTRIVTRLTSPVPEVTKALKSLNVQLYETVDGQSRLKDIGVIFDDLKTSMDKLDLPQRNAMLKQVFGGGLVNQASILLTAGKTGIDEKQRQGEQRMGSMERGAELQKQGTLEAIKGLESAKQDFAIEVKNVFKTPILNYFSAFSNIFNITTDALKKVTKAVQDGGKTLDDWIAIFNKQGLSGLFQGADAHLKPEFEKLGKLFQIAIAVIRALAEEFFTSEFGQVVITALQTLGQRAGDAIISTLAEAMVWGVPVLAGILWDGLKVGAGGFWQVIKDGIPEVVEVIKDGLQHVQAKVSIQNGMPSAVSDGQNVIDPLTGLPLTGMTPFEGGKGGQSHGGGASGEWGNEPITQTVPQEDFGAVAARYARRNQIQAQEAQEARDATLQAEADAKRAETQAMRERMGTAIGLSPEDIASQQMPTDLIARVYSSRFGVKEGNAANVEWAKSQREDQEFAGLDKAGLEKKQGKIQNAQRLLELEQQREVVQGNIATAMDRVKLVIADSGAAIKQYLLNPLNAFMEAIVGIREKFGAIVDTLKTKQVDVAEKYLGTSKEAANKKRAGIVEQSMHRDRELMQVTDDEGKKREIAERLAGKAEQLAEMGVKPQEHAKEAQRLYQEAEKYAGEEEDQQIEAQKIAQNAAKERVGTLENMLKNTESASEKASTLQALQETYKLLGRSQDVAKTEDLLTSARVEEAKEQAEIQKKQLAALEILVELTKREIAQGDEGMTLPVEPTAEDLG